MKNRCYYSKDKQLTQLPRKNNNEKKKEHTWHTIVEKNMHMQMAMK